MARKGKVKRELAAEKVIERPVRFRRYDYLFLIVCEDQKTEPSYFETFKARIPEETVYLRTVGVGRDPKGVVERAIEERDNLAAESKKEVDYIWAVFDKDDADKYVDRVARFEEAFEIASQEQIELAYSNEVFELWLLLYLIDIDGETPIPRNEIYEQLQYNIRAFPQYDTFTYNHHKYDSRTVEIILEIGDLETAIQRAEALFEKQKKLKPIDANPSTRVHVLVQNLLELIEYFSYSPD